jgi:hypothetical protein
VLASRAATVPGYNLPAVERRILEANGITDVNEIYPTDENGNPLIQPPQNPELVMQQAEEERRVLESKDKARIAAQDLAIKTALAEAQIEEIKARTIKTYAEAGNVDVAAMQKDKELAIKALDTQLKAIKGMQDGQRKDRADSAD